MKIFSSNGRDRLWLWLACFLLLAACRNSETEWEKDVPGASGAPVAISLKLAMPSAGDVSGTDSGLDEEREIRDLTVFLYESGDKGVNMNGNPDMSLVLYYESEDLTKDEYGVLHTATREVEGLSTGKKYDILVVANAGSRRASQPRVSLDDLRQELVSEAWKMEEGESYHSFLMSSAGPERNVIQITEANYSPDSPATNAKPVALQRVAARVDYYIWPEYPVEKSEDKVKIVGAKLVNAYKSGSWLLKCLAPEVDAESGFTYLDEETDENAVVDTKKTEAKTSKDYNFPYMEFSTQWEFPQGTDLKIKDSEDRAGFRIGYTLENTNALPADDTEALQKYATGVVFKAEYRPKDFTEARTFFVFQGKIYKTLREAMDNFEGNNTWEESPETTAGITAWRDYALDLRSNDPTGYKDYLMHGINHGTTEHVKNWTDYMREVCGYEEAEDGQVTVTDNTQSVLATYGTKTYQDGICYYTCWIKHARTGAMQYAIVRNNLYELAVRSVKGLGDDVPGETSLDIQVAVKDWNRLEDETIVL